MTRPRVYEFCSCSTNLSMKFLIFINIKIQRNEAISLLRTATAFILNVGILKFMGRQLLAFNFWPAQINIDIIFFRPKQISSLFELSMKSCIISGSDWFRRDTHWDSSYGVLQRQYNSSVAVSCCLLQSSHTNASIYFALSSDMLTHSPWYQFEHKSQPM